MAHHHNVESRDTAAQEDPFSLDAADASNETSNVIAFLLGGVVITGGLLGFLYLDNAPATSRGLARSDGYIRLDTTERVGTAALRRDAPRDVVVTN